MITESKYTDEQIIEALEVRMPHDAICREAYDLIQRQADEIARQRETLDIIRENNTKVQLLMDELRVDIAEELVRTRQRAITEFAEEIIKDVLPKEDSIHFALYLRLQFAICEKAKALRNKEIP